ARLPLTLGMAVMSLVGVAGFAATAMSHLGRAERAQSSLNAMNEILEQRVEERTALLAAALSEREEALTATQAARIRAEQADAAKERVLAAASHDLRQPLQALRLYQTVLNGMTTEPRQTLVLARMEEAMRVGESLLGSLLDASRIQAGVVTPTPTNVALGDMLDQLRSEFAIEARAAGVDLRVRPCGLTINADPLILGRILRHLIANAIKYGKGGRVLVGCRRGGGPRVVVCDQGPGIPPAEQELIFEEFYQIGNEARDRAHGLGLGLSIARKLAAICGHRLTVTSSPKGSTFALTITETSAATQALAPTSV
ncbi:MAG: HAMP domain-containing histidine kinase, partial [Alphaproteobacteria bacterium]|nr:HAMP domain-containing histidine kinase [Alphaproteobacteria bacterium]